MQVWYLDVAGAHPRQADDMVELFAREDGFFWIDVPWWDDEAGALLTGLGCHAMVVEACRRRNYVPTLHGYDDHAFITTQSPLAGLTGHVHLLELDQIIGHHYLVTVHGPLNPEADPDERWWRRGLRCGGSSRDGSIPRPPPSCPTPSPRRWPAGRVR